MLNEKQIYNRLNKVYINEFDGDNPENDLYDEWYGTDETNIWKWTRPNDRDYMLELDLETKVVTAYERKNHREEWSEIGKFK